MRARFHLVPEPLFYKRWHTGNRYHERGPGTDGVVQARARRLRSTDLPALAALKGYLTVVRRAPLSWPERLRCLPAVARWARLRWRALAWDLAFAAIMIVHSKDWRRQRYDPRYWTAAS